MAWCFRVHLCCSFLSAFFFLTRQHPYCMKYYILFIHHLMGIWVVSTFLTINNGLLLTFMSKFFVIIIFYFLNYVPRNATAGSYSLFFISLSYAVFNFFMICQTFFPKQLYQFYIPTSSVKIPISFCMRANSIFYS